MTRVAVLEEHDTPTGWRFAIEIRSRRGGTTTHELTMSFQDYELRCRGTRPPSEIVSGLVTQLVSGEFPWAPKPLPDRFDVGMLGSWERRAAESE